MSYILDALNRSDSHRRLLSPEAAPQARRNAPVPADRRSLQGRLLAGCCVVLVGIALASFWQRHAPLDTDASATSVARSAIERQAPLERAEITMPIAESELAAPLLEPSADPVVPPDDMSPPTPPRPDDRLVAAQIRSYLNLNVHVYDEDPDKRFVMIDYRKYEEGDATPGGIRIESITPHGLVVTQRGRRVTVPLKT